ncbi:Myb-like DNA-binding domain [Musa troglodytarum]|uniref:Myb-like DNA-binding domain n=1 Tax=Musa troglodytarum TaxID=320322 RepID=A0A9E7HJT3_9LILI|nr:Myb-like DNA-binding domain [Musa troglodytarum]
MGNICGMMASWFLGEKGGAGGIGTGNRTQEENKLFEHAVAKRRFDKDTPDRWEKVAAYIPGKTVRDVLSHCRDSLDYASEIEAGWVPCPGHDSSSSAQPSCVGGKRSASDQERKKRVPWTDEEHWRFLLGLKKYGKGNWRNICRNFVTTRTPTQVASHAQKYFSRLEEKRSSSIHDISTAKLLDDRPPSPS